MTGLNPEGKCHGTVTSPPSVIIDARPRPSRSLLLWGAFAWGTKAQPLLVQGYSSNSKYAPTALSQYRSHYITRDKVRSLVKYCI